MHILRKKEKNIFCLKAFLILNVQNKGEIHNDEQPCKTKNCKPSNRWNRTCGSKNLHDIYFKLCTRVKIVSLQLTSNFHALDLDCLVGCCGITVAEQKQKQKTLDRSLRTSVCCYRTVSKFQTSSKTSIISTYFLNVRYSSIIILCTIYYKMYDILSCL